jgi:hypothetical protein
MKFKKYIKESALPPGFDGFDVDDEPAKTKDNNKLPNDIQRGTIVKIRSKWEVFKRVSDYTAWVYKYPTKKRKAYELVSTGKGNFEVWQTGGSGQRLKDKPEEKGKLKIL